MSEREMNFSPAADESGGAQYATGTAPGALLAACRKQRGWTVEQVASQLNLAPRQVFAMESDDYASLPVMAVTRGFIRSYAKLLKIDPAPLLAALGGEIALAQPIASRKALATPFSEARLPSMGQKPGLATKWVFGLLLAILGGVAVWASRQGSDLSSLSVSASNQVKDGIAYFSANGGSAQSNAKKVETTPGSQGGGTAVASGALQVSSTLTSPEPAPVVTEQPAAPAVSGQNTQVVQPEDSTAVLPAPQTASDASPASDKNVLVLTAREDSWVKIKHAENKSILFSRLLKAGTTETIQLTGPVKVLIGNSDGIDVTLRGVPVEIKSGKGKVARLTLK